MMKNRIALIFIAVMCLSTQHSMTAVDDNTTIDEQKKGVRNMPNPYHVLAAIPGGILLASFDTNPQRWERFWGGNAGATKVATRCAARSVLVTCSLSSCWLGCVLNEKIQRAQQIQEVRNTRRETEF